MKGSSRGFHTPRSSRFASLIRLVSAATAAIALCFKRPKVLVKVAEVLFCKFPGLKIRAGRCTFERLMVNEEAEALFTEISIVLSE